MRTRWSQYVGQYPRRTMLYGLLGGLCLLLILLVVNSRNFRPLKGKSTWTVTSNYSQEGARFAIDQDMKTPWSSYFKMTSGMFVQVDLGHPALINGLVLHVGKNRQGQPQEWGVKTSIDGIHWQTVSPRKAIVYRAMLVIPFEKVRARYAQIVQTSVASSQFPWLIHELDVLQPIVPWQFEASTLIFWIAGCLLALGIGTVFCLFFRKKDKAAAPGFAFLPVVMTVILLAAWGARNVELQSYDLSARELSYISTLSGDEYTHEQWLSAYFGYSKTGPFWLSLFLVRLFAQWCQSQLIAFRLVPALFAVLAACLLCLAWRYFSRDKRSFFEPTLAAALVSIAGYTLFLSRNGDFAPAFLCVFLLFALLSYHAVYRKSSYFWFGLVPLLLVVGSSLHPLAAALPPAVIGVSGVVWILRIFVPQKCSAAAEALPSKQFGLRLLLYFGSVLPLYLAWGFVFGKYLNGMAFTWQGPALDQFFQSLRFSGFIGPIGWLLWGLAILGGVRLIRSGSRGEWFFSLLGLCCVLAAWGWDAAVSALVFSVVVLCLVVKGSAAILSWTRSVFRTELPWTIWTGALWSALALYFGLFALNSLFWGSPYFPFAPELYAQSRLARNLSDLTKYVTDDPSPCKTVIIRDQRLVNVYNTEFDLDAKFFVFPDMQRLATQGIFMNYIFTDAAEAIQNQEVAEFLNRYYVELGQSARVVLHGLREDFSQGPQRYSAQDLFFNIGNYVQDPAASRKFARVVTPADPPGFLAFGPFCPICTPGRYRARFTLRVGERTEQMVASLSVVTDPRGFLAARSLKGTDFPSTDAYYQFDLPFEVDFSENPVYPRHRLQFVIQVPGSAEVRLDYIELLADHEDHL